MTDKEIKKLIKQVKEYKEYCISDKNNPFGYQDAYWAAGFENFLNWLSIKSDDR